MSPGEVIVLTFGAVIAGATFVCLAISLFVRLLNRLDSNYPITFADHDDYGFTGSSFWR